MNQQTLDFEPHVEEVDKPRLARQCRLILERLQQGPATNVQLAVISIKYTGRISDLRGAGFEITATRLHGGLWEYRLIESAEGSMT